MARMTKTEIAAARAAGMRRQGLYLRKLRAATILTQSEIAKALGVRESLVQAWEHGRSWVAIEHQETLAETLGVSVAGFVLKLALFRNPVLSAVVWAPGTASVASGCHAGA